MNMSALSFRNATLTAAGALLCAGSVFAADMSGASAQDRYRAERAACESGQSGQDRATCLREVGAARQERQRNNLNNVQSDAQLRANAAARCDRLPPERRSDCMALRGDDVQVQGSVPGGAVLRQTTIRTVGEPQPVAPAGGTMTQPGMAQPMPAPGAAQPMPAQPMHAPGATHQMPAPGTMQQQPMQQPMPAPGTMQQQQMPAPGSAAPTYTVPSTMPGQTMPQGTTTAPYGSGMGTGTGMR